MEYVLSSKICIWINIFFIMIDNNVIRAEIIKEYGTLTKAAEDLGIAQTTFSRNLKVASPEFLERLRAKGVKIPYETYDEIPVLREPSISYKLEDRIKELEAEVIKLKAEIYDLRKNS